VIQEGKGGTISCQKGEQNEGGPERLAGTQSAFGKRTLWLKGGKKMRERAG